MSLYVLPFLFTCLCNFVLFFFPTCLAAGRLFASCWGRGKAGVLPDPKQAAGREAANLNIVVSQNTSKDKEASRLTDIKPGWYMKVQQGAASRLFCLAAIIQLACCELHIMSWVFADAGCLPGCGCT